jgi:oxygen-independent coproporphyrinogen-3 oxidase
MDGKRFYYDRDFNAFMNGNPPIQDGVGGDFTEYAMLNLRLVEGLNETRGFERFGHNIPNEIYEKSQIFIDNGYMTKTENGLALTRKGFLLSNSILSEIL